MRLLPATAAFALLLSACANSPDAPVRTAEVGDAPTACGDDFRRHSTTLTLPPAESAPVEPRKGVPLKFASEFPVGGGVRDIGRWHEAAPDWLAWRLRLKSEGARSLSLHFRPFDLPPDAALWLCTPGGAQQGPYTGMGPSGRGGLWTPALRGSELWVEILVPESQKQDVRAKIAEAFAEFKQP